MLNEDAFWALPPTRSLHWHCQPSIGGPVWPNAAKRAAYRLAGP